MSFAFFLKWLSGKKRKEEEEMKFKLTPFLMELRSIIILKLFSVSTIIYQSQIGILQTYIDLEKEQFAQDLSF